MVLENLYALTLNCTNKCNLNCAYCKVDRSSQDMSFETIESILDNTVELQTYCLIIAGGEPLLRKDIFDIIDYANNQGLFTCLCTNATLIDQDMASKIKDSSLDMIRFTLDSTIESKQDSIKGTGTFKRIVNAIQMLSDSHIGVNLNIPVNYDNINEAEDFVNFALKYKIRTIRFSPIINSKVHKDLYVDLLKKIIMLNNKYKSHLNFGNFEVLYSIQDFYNQVSQLKCPGGKISINVNSDGTVTKCPYLSESCANLNVCTLKEAWLKLYNSPPTGCDACCGIDFQKVFKEVLDDTSLDIGRSVSSWYAKIFKKEKHCLRDLPCWYMEFK